MAEKSTTYFLYCSKCNFQQDVAKMLPRTPFETVEDLVKEAHRFHCSVCGAKHVAVRESD